MRELVATLKVSTVLLSEVFLITMEPVTPLAISSLKVMTSAVGGTMFVALSAGLSVVRVGAPVSITNAGDKLPL